MSTERTVIEALVIKALGLGYIVSINDGEEWCLKRSSDKKAIMKALFSVDEERMMFRDSHDAVVGSVYLVHGNAADGSEVIADHTDNEAIAALVEGL